MHRMIKVQLLDYMKTWCNKVHGDPVEVKGSTLKQQHELQTKKQIIEFAKQQYKRGVK